MNLEKMEEILNLQGEVHCNIYLKITSKIGSNNFTQFQKISDSQSHDFPPKKLLAMSTLFIL